MSVAKKGHERPDMSTARINQGPKPRTKEEAARRMAQIVEKSMDREGLSEEKKNERVQKFVEHVDAVNAARATRAK